MARNVTAALVPVAGPVEALNGTESQIIDRVFPEGGICLMRVSPDAVGYVDDMGLYKGLPVNTRASRIYFRMTGVREPIVGPLIVFSNPDPEGYCGSVPQDVLKVLRSLEYPPLH